MGKDPLITKLPLPKNISLGLKVLNGVTTAKKDIPFPNINLKEIEVPALICGSWSAQGLHSRGAFNGYLAISSQEKWLYTHGGEEWTVSNSKEALDYQLAFFDRYLKDNQEANRPISYLNPN